MDESGDHRPFRGTGGYQAQYLGLAGVVFAFPDEQLVAGVERLQRVVSRDRDDPPCLHREDIVNRRGPFRVLRNDAKRTEFDAALLGLLETLRMVTYCVVVDKQVHLARQSPQAAHPYHFGVHLLLERYVGRLGHRGATGDVMAEARGKREDGFLRAEYIRLYNGGTKYHRAEQFQRVLTSKELKVRPKASNVAGLQIADLLAHPLKRDVLRSATRLGPADGFEAELLAVVIPRYNRRPSDGRVEGYGRVLV